MTEEETKKLDRFFQLVDAERKRRHEEYLAWERKRNPPWKKTLRKLIVKLDNKLDLNLYAEFLD